MQNQPQQQPATPNGKAKRNPIIVALVAIVLGCVVLACAGGVVGAITSGGSGNTSTSQTPSQDTAKPIARSTSTPKATPKPKAWVTVEHFTGSASGTKSLDTFHLQTGDHIVWHTAVHDSANLFIADLYAKGTSYGNDLPYMNIADVVNDTSQGDTITVQSDSADVYLWVQSDSVTWTVDVQRYQ